MQWILAILLTNIGNMGNFAPEKLGRTRGELQKMQFLGIQSYHLRSAKICIFLRYTHITPFFGVRRTRLNGIISPPYPEVTLDTFGFPVGGRLAGRFVALIAQSGPFLAQKRCFWPEINFLCPA